MRWIHQEHRDSPHIDGLVQERRNSIANTLELRLSCTNPSICGPGHRASNAESVSMPLQWRYYGLDGVSNHQPHDCLLNRLFRRRSKKTLKLRVIGLCVGNSPRTCEFPALMASNAEKVSIWWRHHAMPWCYHDDPIGGSSVWTHNTHVTYMMMSRSHYIRVTRDVITTPL